MPTFVALLRGINVGKAKRVPMVELRALLSDLGYTGVATLLNSGNAVFNAATGSTAWHAGQIAAAISSRMALDVPVVVKSAKELAAIIGENPLVASATDESRLLVVFVQQPRALADLKGIEPLVKPPEQLAIGKSAAYLHCAMGILASKAGEAMLAHAGKSVTTRNWATVRKLQALVAESAV